MAFPQYVDPSYKCHLAFPLPSQLRHAIINLSLDYELLLLEHNLYYDVNANSALKPQPALELVRNIERQKTSQRPQVQEMSTYKHLRFHTQKFILISAAFDYISRHVKY